MQGLESNLMLLKERFITPDAVQQLSFSETPLPLPRIDRRYALGACFSAVLARKYTIAFYLPARTERTGQSLRSMVESKSSLPNVGGRHYIPVDS
jgi:hypothetical protein